MFTKRRKEGSTSESNGIQRSNFQSYCFKYLELQLTNTDENGLLVKNSKCNVNQYRMLNIHCLQTLFCLQSNSFSITEMSPCRSIENFGIKFLHPSDSVSCIVACDWHKKADYQVFGNHRTSKHDALSLRLVIIIIVVLVIKNYYLTRLYTLPVLGHVFFLWGHVNP